MNEVARSQRAESTIAHSTFRVERHYPQPPARVFHAFSDKETVRRWRVQDDGCEIYEFTFDFRIGGTEVSRFSFGGGPEIRLDAQFQDIVPDGRIVFGYRMSAGGATFSVSLTTVELLPAGDGTRVIYTEQGAFFGGIDSVSGREEGCRLLLEKLAAELQK